VSCGIVSISFSSATSPHAVFIHLLQLGHQAVNCTNGTINWKQIYGDDAFRLKRPIYESDYRALKKSKQVDLVDLEKRARQYAKVCGLGPAQKSLHICDESEWTGQAMSTCARVAASTAALSTASSSG
jgi:hypothetical protein